MSLALLAVGLAPTTQLGSGLPVKSGVGPRRAASISPAQTRPAPGRPLPVPATTAACPPESQWGDPQAGPQPSRKISTSLLPAPRATPPVPGAGRRRRGDAVAGPSEGSGGAARPPAAAGRQA